MTIDRAFEILQTFEGGAKITGNPYDAGGLTRYGISHAAYPNLDIANLTEDKAKAIYATDYWLKGNCFKLKPELQYVHFDTSVNMGVATAIKLLQEAANIPADGIFGAQTLVQSDKVSIEAYLLLREWRCDEIVVHRKDQIVFLGGWENRNKTILKMYKAGALTT